MVANGGIAAFGDVVARDIVEVADDPAALDAGGWWAVVAPFEGGFRGYRFADVRCDALEDRTCVDVPLEAWSSSMDASAYQQAVSAVRADIARGWVYQVNLCRVLEARLAEPIDAVGLWQRLARANPAPHAGLLCVPGELDVMSASPESLLSRRGDRIVSSPIKGTAPTPEDMLEKDAAENIMIVDLVRNDLARIAQPGSVAVPDLMRVEQHPGLVHLVSDVSATVGTDVSWADLLASVMPPGSVSGAPKSSALEVIRRLEPSSRDVYCGAFGWVDATARRAELAVAIRTFWQRPSPSGATLRFGTGAGITWGSDPLREWEETQLKARRLLGAAAGEGEDALLGR